MRMFIALQPELAAVEHLTDFLEIMPAHEGKPRWLPPAAWHITCVFLGEITPEQADGLTDSLAEIAATTPPPTLRLAGSGAFPHPLKPRVLFMGVEDPGAALPPLFRATRKTARRVGVHLENRAQLPHLTIARGRPEPDPKWWARSDLYEGPWWQPQTLQLMSSRPGAGPGGSSLYRSEAAFAFDGE